jgi:hypothetical protein
VTILTYGRHMHESGHPARAEKVDGMGDQLKAKSPERCRTVTFRNAPRRVFANMILYSYALSQGANTKTSSRIGTSFP